MPDRTQNSVSKHESRLSLKESASEETRTVGERISMQEERSRDSLLMKLPKVTSVGSVESRNSNIAHRREIKPTIDCQGTQLHSGQAGHVLCAERGKIGRNVLNGNRQKGSKLKIIITIKKLINDFIETVCVVQNVRSKMAK